MVACLPVADMVSALVAAYHAGTGEAFWRDLAPVDVFLLDDAHPLAGQEGVQEPLLEGLVGWLEGGRRLVLTSDRTPSEMPALATRVRQRLEGGVIAAIGIPEPALRVAILEYKARLHGLILDSHLASRLAGAIGGNVRRLEGALTRLLAHARLEGRPLDESLAVEVLDELRAAPTASLSIDAIIEETALAFGAVARALRAPGRRPEVVLPRQVAMYLARRLLGRSFPNLASAFGRDHTTVLYACRTVAARLGVDNSLGTLVAGIERRLTADPR